MAVGVFYRPDDYVGVGKRLLIDFIDTVSAIAGCALLTLLLIYTWPHARSLGIAIMSGWTAIWIGYFVFLKRSRFRTLGYALTGARIVNLQGQRPSVFSLVIRLLWVAGGPANFIIDLFWTPSDPSRQAIRDKFAHTYVIKKAAVPLGESEIVYRTYNIFGTTFFFPEVRELTSS